jgi:hypothetical protein
MNVRSRTVAVLATAVLGLVIVAGVLAIRGSGGAGSDLKDPVNTAPRKGMLGPPGAPDAK